jgi:hypothetical protein
MVPGLTIDQLRDMTGVDLQLALEIA